MTTLTWVGSPADGPTEASPRVRPRGSPDVSVNSCLRRGHGRVPALAWSSCYPRGSAGWPAERPAAEDMGVGVEHRLPGLRPGVEDHPVPGLAYPFVLGNLVRQGRHLVQQAVVGRGLARYDPAEKALRHGAILACHSPDRPPTYMVAWLRILGARLAIARGTTQTGSTRAQRCDARIGYVTGNS